MNRPRLGVAVAVAMLVLGGGCSDDESPSLSLPDASVAADDTTNDESADDEADPLQGEPVYVAQAVDSTLVVRSAAQENAEELVTLEAEDELSGAIVCIVVQQLGDWLEVELPSGPTDRTGWVARDDVALSRHRFRVEVSLSEHTLTLYTGEIVALTTPVAIGPDAPEAGDELFIKDLVQTPDPAGPYGTLAYGLSGSDNEQTKFTSGSGVVAVHGTADPSALGRDVPYGSIAVGPDIVTRLSETIGLPLGTPVAIVE